MLIWLLNFVFAIVYWALTLALWVLPIFIILRLVMPQNKYLLLASKYLEIPLAQVRKWLSRLFSRLGSSSSFDVAPLALWLLIIVARWLLLLVQDILL